jgi:hypothetical protein
MGSSPFSAPVGGIASGVAVGATGTVGAGADIGTDVGGAIGPGMGAAGGGGLIIVGPTGVRAAGCGAKPPGVTRPGGVIMLGAFGSAIGAGVVGYAVGHDIIALGSTG